MRQFPLTYQNGNVKVTIQRDGTKTREFEGEPKPEFPESLDIKITDRCDLECSFCHESSTKKGEQGNLDKLKEVLKGLPEGVELAIGGGNPLEFSLSQLMFGLDRHIINLTINQHHLTNRDGDCWLGELRRFVSYGILHGIGVSVTKPEELSKLNKLLAYTDNVVFHVIAGVHNYAVVDELLAIKRHPKILVLGYKHWGRGVEHWSPLVEARQKWWYRKIPQYIECGVHFSFDNLAIEQMNLKRLFTPEGWNSMYMGDDFTSSMYIDAVKGEFARTSRSPERVSWNDMSLLEFFQKK